ncbi:MAG: beta-propeller fold lactonase family protein [Lachnospiraceae bacterium]
MKNSKYVAYVSTYTSGDQHGIKIYDVDMDYGVFCPKDKVEITNSSYITISHCKRYLYSITDFGVESFKILPDGGLEYMNSALINGMRGCYISTDYDSKFLFVSGYHDGKVTVLRILEGGLLGEIVEEVYHKGMGSVAERNFRPHVNSARMTRDNKYLCVSDVGMDHVKIYRIEHTTGKLKFVDVIRGSLESAPRHVRVSKDGRFIYIVYEIKMYIEVYEYSEKNGFPYFEKIQTISTIKSNSGYNSAASTLKFSEDYQYLLTSNAGDDSVSVYSVDQETGLLDMKFCLPVSGEYPKDAALFPDNKHLVSLNHESNSMTFFKTDLEKGLLIMHGKALEVAKPNTIVFHKLK